MQNNLMVAEKSGYRCDEQEIELCDAASVARLVASRGTRARRSLRGLNLSEREASGSRPRTCKCGVCRFCLENKRWNHIFEQKFADPTYYSGPIVRHSSSLHLIG